MRSLAVIVVAKPNEYMWCFDEFKVGYYRL